MKQYILLLLIKKQHIEHNAKKTLRPKPSSRPISLPEAGDPFLRYSISPPFINANAISFYKFQLKKI